MAPPELGTLAKPIDVIHRAIIALNEDIAMFEAMGYHKRHTAASNEFLRSLCYYSEVLILDSLIKMESEFQAYACTPASRAIEPHRSIGSGLADARVSFSRFLHFIRRVLDEAGWEVSWNAPSTGDMVPTACPYQLLYQMICMEKLSSASTDQIPRTFLSLQKQAYLSLPQLPPGIKRVTSNDNCGRPTMIFIAGTLDLSRLVFGANETAWGDLTAVSAITRKARDIRLRHYITPAMQAFQALHRKEVEALTELQGNSGGNFDGAELLWRARSRAMEQMRSDDSFLGGENEMGLALRPPSWSINQGCYLCQGMMGYKSPKVWNENQRRRYILTFD
ncbi:uncharacterized protein TrAFT101_010973 [Trichoderma asperellum]|uniref:uncharacterized protein n=1 Tax=Trichoderma asperellum TaxID=101201 RepID=UPI003333A15C|nr:hypothetical protein TrAFT101_010973 [Trichoderma asperellum]